jgi:hypothetical protein
MATAASSILCISFSLLIYATPEGGDCVRNGNISLYMPIGNERRAGNRIWNCGAAKRGPDRSGRIFTSRTARSASDKQKRIVPGLLAGAWTERVSRHCASDMDAARVLEAGPEPLTKSPPALGRYSQATSLFAGRPCRSASPLVQPPGRRCERFRRPHPVRQPEYLRDIRRRAHRQRMVSRHAAHLFASITGWILTERTANARSWLPGP